MHVLGGVGGRICEACWSSYKRSSIQRTQKFIHFGDFIEKIYCRSGPYLLSFSLLIFVMPSDHCYALVIGFPEEEGGGWADVGEYGDYMGTLHHISAPVVWEMWDLEF